MHVSAYLIKTAQLNAAKEDGKFSELYEKEATTCFIHPEDLETWALKEGTNIKCINHENNKNLVLRIKGSRFVRKGCINIPASPWTNDFFNRGKSLTEIEIVPTSESPVSLNELLSLGNGGLSS